MMNIRKNVLHAGTALSVSVLLALGQTPVALAGEVGVNLKPPIECFTAGTEHSGALITPAYRQARAFLGTTPEEIQEKFAAIQEMNFSQGDAKQIVSRLSDKELGDVAYFYNQSRPTGNNQLLMIMAQRLDGKSLVRVAKAFGSNATRAAVQKYASPEVKESFSKQLAATPNVKALAEGLPSMSVFAGAVHTMAAPSHFMTLPDIYLDYRTAPVGSLSAGAALTETTIYAGTNLMAAWGVGYAFGTGIHDLIETYAPQWDDVIGGTIQSSIENIDDAMNEFGQGNYESAADDLFGVSLGNTGYFSGDWDTGASYDFYEGGGGGGC